MAFPSDAFRRTPQTTSLKSQLQSEEATLASNPHDPSSAAYLAYPVKHVVSSLYRRMTEAPERPVHKLLDAPPAPTSTASGHLNVPRRTASPFQPPPLTPLELKHSLGGDVTPSLLLTRPLAEEIRLLIPPRLQLVGSWRLAYSLAVHGSSLATLYEECAKISLYTQRSGYIVVVRDGSAAADTGSVFGAYLTDCPKAAQHYFGTGECFLWRASILPTLRSFSISGNKGAIGDLLDLSGLPPPPSTDTTNLQRMTTIRSERRTSSMSPPAHSPATSHAHLAPPQPMSGTSTPDSIRFKAFPYSGVNDFMIYCQSDYLSVGGGDGHYGLWLDDSLDSGLSEACPTFGNEPLSDEGRKFDVLGVEVWYVGA